MANKYFQFRKSSLLSFRNFSEDSENIFQPNICVLPKINLALGIAFSYKYGTERDKKIIGMVNI